MKNHYYFKFGEQNKLIKKYLVKENQSDLEIGQILPLSIYFGKWNCEEYHNGKYVMDKDVQRSQSRSQVKLFFEINMESYFWVFYLDKIFVFSPVNDKIIDGDLTFKDSAGSLPKTRNCKLIHIILKDEVPEIFRTINANQKYNRKTIEEIGKKSIANSNLENDEEDILITIANSIVKNSGKYKPVEISSKKCLNYLSPIQFETLIFLIFHHSQVFCSTFRGGTLKDIDLTIKCET